MTRAVLGGEGALARDTTGVSRSLFFRESLSGQRRQTRALAAARMITPVIGAIAYQAARIGSASPRVRVARGRPAPTAGLGRGGVFGVWMRGPGARERIQESDHSKQRVLGGHDQWGPVLLRALVQPR